MIVIENMLDSWMAAMWRASWQGGLMALAVWFFLLIVPSIPARFQSWLWRLVMLKFLVAFLWQVPLELPLLRAGESTVSMANVFSLDDAIPPESVYLLTDQSPNIVQPIWIAFVVWIVIVQWQFARLALACRNARQLRGGCRLTENKQLLKVLKRSSRLIGFSTPPLVFESKGQGSPLLVGILRPAIVLPNITLSRLNASEQRLVISHELAHVARRDLIWSLVAAVIRAVFFFHPLAWVSERKLGLTQEMAADELAIEIQMHDPAKYASLLVSVVSKLGPVRIIPTMSVGAVGTNNTLKQRLYAMRFMKTVSPQSAIVYGLVLGLVAVPCLVPCTFVATTISAAEQSESKESTIIGKFVSVKDGILKVGAVDERSEAPKEYEWKIAEETKVISHIRGAAKEGTARDAFKLWEPGAMIVVKLIDNKVMFVELGKKNSADRVPERSADGSSQAVKSGWGEFVSFKSGTLTLESNAGIPLSWSNIQHAKTMVWNQDAGVYAPKSSSEALGQIKPRTWTSVRINKDEIVIHVGAKKGQVTGTLVSFKNDRLLMLGQNLGESFTKKYGNNMQFNKFRDDVPFYESIDGSEYKLIGTANKLLGNVEEGTILTVHSEGDDNITRIDMGTPRKK